MHRAFVAGHEIQSKNHTHETGGIQLGENKKSYLCGIRELGNWMRRAHSRFGAGYNRRHNRQGKVAYDRPKTSEIENDQQVLRVMFYGDVNPVRAGMVSHPSKYGFSSYKYYACGKRGNNRQKTTNNPRSRRINLEKSAT